MVSLAFAGRALMSNIPLGVTLLINGWGKLIEGIGVIVTNKVCDD
jgi:hypothetical protein